MTILKTLENILEEINTQLGSKMCENATQDGNHFTYDFDGYICCDLVIEPNGVVFESVDENPAQRYESVLDWAQNIINQMNT